MPKTLKNLLVLLITVGSIALAAFLPSVIAVIQDHSDNQQIQFAPISPVQLDIREELTATDRLALMLHLEEGIEISEEEPKMTMRDVHDAIYAALEPYYASGLMLPLEETYNHFSPVFVRDVNHPERFGIFWVGQIVQETEPYPVLDLAIDDETGKILYIGYSMGTFIYEESELTSKLQIFSEIYFNALGITDYQEHNDGELFYGENVNGIRYIFESTEYDAVVVDCMSFRNGLYTIFSSQSTVS